MKKTSKGFSLLELLFSIGIMSLIATGITVIFNDWFKDSIDLKVGQETQRMILSAKEYVSLNFDEIIATEIPTVGNTVELDINDLIAGGFLPASFDNFNSFRQRQRLFMHHLSATTVRGASIEIVLLGDDLGGTDSRKSAKRLLNAATKGGPSVGVLSDLNPNIIRSSYGTWEVPLARYSAFYTNTANATGGYMAAHALVSNDTVITQNYLFRSATAGAPELNRMEINIDMVNNSIDNAGTVIVDSSIVGGNTVFNASGVVTSSPYILAVEDDLNIRNLNVNRSNNEGKGNVIVSGDGTTGVDFEVTGAMTVLLDGGPAGGFVRSASLGTTNLNATGNSKFNQVNANNTSINAGNIYASNAQYSGSITANDFQAVNVTRINQVRAGSAAVTNTVVSGGSNINTNVNISNGVAVRGRTNLNSLMGTNTVTINNMTSCGSGCP